MNAVENPPAFPVAEQRAFDGAGITEGSCGMSLRDWFAGQMLNGIGTWPPCPPEGWPIGPTDHGEMHRLRAEYAYAAADAMLAERLASLTRATSALNDETNEMVTLSGQKLA